MIDVSVYFCIYEPYENIPSHTYSLGTTNIHSVMEMIEKIESGTLPRGSCIDSFSAYLHKYIYMRQTPISQKNSHNTSPISLEIYNLWATEYPTMKCISCKSHPCYKNALRKCATNLATGKCQDEYMRQTIGTILFPQFYHNTKQK